MLYEEALPIAHAIVCRYLKASTSTDPQAAIDRETAMVIDVAKKIARTSVAEPEKQPVKVLPGRP